MQSPLPNRPQLRRGRNCIAWRGDVARRLSLRTVGRVLSAPAMDQDMISLIGLYHLHVNRGLVVIDVILMLILILAILDRCKSLENFRMTRMVANMLTALTHATIIVMEVLETYHLHMGVEEEEYRRIIHLVMALGGVVGDSETLLMAVVVEEVDIVISPLPLLSMREELDLETFLPIMGRKK